MKKKSSDTYDLARTLSAQRELDAIPVRRIRDDVSATIQMAFMRAKTPPEGYSVPDLPDFYCLDVCNYSIFYHIEKQSRMIVIVGVLEEGSYKLQ